jgi:PAS domain S-box-containing protein
MMAAKKKKPDEKEAGASGSTRSMRDNAEKELARSPAISPGLAGQTAEELIHELRVHQIELEMQAEELRGAHLALENSRDNYLDLYEFAPIGYLTLTDKGIITNVNLTGATLLGMERSKLLRAPFSKFIAEKESDQWYRYFTNVLKQDTKQNCTFMIRRGDGSTFPARLEGIRITGSSEGTPTVRVVISDMTEISRAKETLLESEERYRTVLENVPDLILVHRKGIILYINPAATEVLGYTHGEVINKPMTDFIAPEYLSLVAQSMSRRMDGETVEPYEIEILTKSGKRRTVVVGGSLIEFAGSPASLNVLTDITERKHAEDALRQANKQLNLLSSITRHDILNQLMALKGYLELSHDVIDNPATLNEYITKEEKAANTIEHQITFTKIYQELGAAAPEWQNVNASIQKAVAGLPMRDIHVVVDSKAPEIFADPLLEKVFYNLIDNALRYGGAGMKTIRVSSQESDARLTILCEDDGVGIIAEDKKRLFTRGFGKNTGLGLFLSREILSITGITITENGMPSNGARFEIVVPKGMWRSAGKGD